MVEAVPGHARIGAWLLAIAVVVFMLAPLAVVAGASVSQAQFIAFPPDGFTLRWYGEILSSERYLAAAETSLRLALVVTATVVVCGLGAAVAIHRRRLPGSALLATLLLSPLILPTIVFAIGLLMTWSLLVGQPSFLALWLGHSAIALPYVARTTLAVLADSDPHLEEAARTMGARWWQRLLLVVLPQCLPGLLAGGFFAFNISFDEAVVSLFLRTPDLVTLPIQIYSQIEFSPDPAVAAVSTLLVVLTVLIVAAVNWLFGLRFVTER